MLSARQVESISTFNFKAGLFSYLVPISMYFFEEGMFSRVLLEKNCLTFQLIQLSKYYLRKYTTYDFHFMVWVCKSVESAEEEHLKRDCND